MDGWPAAPVIASARLALEPLTVEHAAEMAPLLADPALYAFMGGAPLPFHALCRRYRRQALGRSEDGAQRWFNWIVRLEPGGPAVGTVQATVAARGDGFIAEVAWVVAVAHQRRGYATEAARAMARWLGGQGASVLVANIHPGHEASMRVARALGLEPTDEMVAGEVRWVGATVSA